jgi:hypothetical protein
VPLSYQAVGKKLLLVEELPQGVLARYERDVSAIAHIISHRGVLPEEPGEWYEVQWKHREGKHRPLGRVNWERQAFAIG